MKKLKSKHIMIIILASLVAIFIIVDVCLLIANLPPTIMR